MNSLKPIYEDGNMKIEVSDFITINEEIAKLDMFQRIRILEYITGMRNISEIKDEEEAKFVKRVLLSKLFTKKLPSELDPEKWHLPPNSNHR